MGIAALINEVRNAENPSLRQGHFYRALAEALTGLDQSVNSLERQLLTAASSSSSTSSSGTPASSPDLTFLEVPYAASITPAWQDNNQIIRVQLTGNLSVAFPTNMSDGRRLRFIFEADGSNRNVTLNSSWYNMPASLAPIVVLANTYTYIEFTQFDLTNGRCLSIVQNHLV